jgi:hypothetical protein
MASNNIYCPPQSSAANQFSNNLVGVQLVTGGGLTQANFNFTTGISEKQNRTFTIGTFSDPINLESMNIQNQVEAADILSTNYRVYPNYDLSQVTNFTQYGSLVKRLSVSVTKIINYYPGGLEVNPVTPKFVKQETAINISYDQQSNDTTLEIYLTSIQNPFEIDYSQNAETNMMFYEMPVSPLRNMKLEYKKYVLYVNGTQYPLNYLYPTTSNSTTLKIIVDGNPFSGYTSTSDYLVVRPNDFEINKVFNLNFDSVENFLLNRNINPPYTAQFFVPTEQDDGSYLIIKESVMWPRSGLWNLDIISGSFDNYLEKINAFSLNLDQYNTNLISRFMTTGALKEFDTPDQKFEKLLQIYGRSFDETRSFITTLGNINSVNYTIKNDIPSQLLKNLAQTLGWVTNFSPISQDELLQAVFTTQPNKFSGLQIGPTPEEINYQFYRNLIINSAYLFKSKGTRKSIECLLRMVGAPEALIDFNEYIYVADTRINMSEFDQQYAQISLGNYTQEFPVLETTNVFSIHGIQYTGFTTTTTNANVLTTRDDYPLDNFGCPKMPLTSDDYFFQIGGGWYQSTPDHRMPEFAIPTNEVFVGDNPNFQTQLLPFNYGQEYLYRYRYFPYMDLGFKLRNVIDNKKSWIDTNTTLRTSSDGGFTSYYSVGEECLTLNVKNVDVMINPGQGLSYDVWSMSREYNYPIPEQGLFYTPPSPCYTPPNQYPKAGGVDWTRIVPKPKQKTFFEFAQTFWRNMINTRNRQFITDGKTGGYPTLQSIYWKYLESLTQAGIPNNNFTYKTMIDFVNGMGDYWIRLVEQMVPATTIWNTGVRLENSIFHRQKFVWRRQEGCKFLPIPCKPCSLTTQLYVLDCPVQEVVCGLYPWNSNPNITSFAVVLTQTLQDFFISQNVDPNSCQLNTTTSTWYVDIRINGVVISYYEFFNGIGTGSFPTPQQWVTAVKDSFINLLTLGYSYNIDEDTEELIVFNNNCIPNFDDFELNVGINFEIFCNG